METFLSFVSEHVFLAVLFLVTIVMLVIEELRPKGALEAADAAILIQKGACVLDIQEQAKRKNLLKNGQLVSNPRQFAWDKYKNKKLVLYCIDGSTSKDIVKDLRTKGFDAYFIAGGIHSWQKDGFEVIANSEN